MFGLEAWIFWLVLAAIFFVAEMMTINLVTIWFVIGACGATLVALLGLSIGAQIGVFLLLSIIFVAVFWRMRDRLSLSVRKAALTNADRILGQQALVTVEINALEGSGQVKVMGQLWSAVSDDQSVIPVGENVTVIAIKGVKAVVTK